MIILKYIAMLILLAIGLQAQDRNAPVPGKDVSDSVAYLLWQFDLNSGSSINHSTPAGPDQLILKTGKMSHLSFDMNMTTPDGYTIRSIRVLDTLNYGDSLTNTLFPALAVNYEGSGIPLDSFITSGNIDIGYVDIDSTASKKVVLRNTGNSKLILPVGNFYDIASGTLSNGMVMGKTFIARSNPIYLNDVEWQTRQGEIPPVQGAPLQYADSIYDDLTISIDPGDTVSFYIDARPTVLGRKQDTLVIEYADGLQNFVLKAPIDILSAWTVKYYMDECRVRPATPSYDGSFIDTIRIFGNKGKRTRITSMRIAISFNPRDIAITGFEANPDIFPDGWKYRVQNFVESEKYGKIYIEAWADTNRLLKQNVSDPDELSYFESATDQEELFGLLKGRKLLGTSDSSFFMIDTLQSRHNYTMEYLFDTDTEIFDEALPYMSTVGGLVLSDSLMFADKLYLSNITADFIINNMYPNPAQDATFVTLDLFVFTSGSIDAKIGFIDPYTGIKTGNEISQTLDPGKNSVDINIETLGGESYFVYVSTDNTTDIWLLNILH